MVWNYISESHKMHLCQRPPIEANGSLLPAVAWIAIVAPSGGSLFAYETANQEWWPVTSCEMVAPQIPTQSGQMAPF